MFISWPTKRLLMAEVSNEHDAEAGSSHDGRSSPGGVTPATLASALDSVRQGYEPYAGFPAAFVAEELKLLIRQHGPKYEASDLLTDRDWKYRDLGREPVVVTLDPDLGEYLNDFIQCNPDVEQDGYANQLFENAVQEELGRGQMIVNRQGGIVLADCLVERGTLVHADRVAGECQKRHVTAKVDGRTVEGVVDATDLLRPDHAAQDRELILQRAKQALAGLNVAIHPLAGEGEAGSHMVKVACDTGDPATLAEVHRRLKAAGLVAYTQGRSVLHVRADS